MTYGLIINLMKGYNKLQLPSNYAQRLLDNEIEFKLSDNPSTEVTCTLIQLYAQGVEYYESIKSYKYLYFKKKIQEIFSCDRKLFSKPEVKPEEEISPIRKKLNSQNETEKMEALKMKEKQQKMEIEVHERIKKDVTIREAEKIMKNMSEKTKIVQNKIKTSLETQDKLLEQKLMLRKRRSFCKSFSAYGFTQGTQTKDSLFNDESINKGQIQPMISNFDFNALIKQDESDDEKQIVLQKKSILTRGKMASMGKF